MADKSHSDVYTVVVTHSNYKLKIFTNRKFICYLALVVITLAHFSCDWKRRNNFKLYSADRKQCITIITESKIRYIIDGKHNSVPETGYVKLDVSGVDELGDAVGVCWKKGKYEWEIVNDNSKVIENRLDSLKYKFNTSWEEDERGIPNQAKYIQANCDVLDILRMEFLPNTGKVILEN